MTPVQPVPPAIGGIPYLTIRGAGDAIAFYQRVFGAEVVIRLDDPSGGVVHGHLRVGPANFMLTEERPQMGALSPAAIGGSSTMVTLYFPDCDAIIQRALDAVRAQRAEAVPAPLLHFSPAGRRLDQALVQQLAAGPGAVLLCGRYEGVDQRFLDAQVSCEISLGDFVLSGGELPALALLDAVARLMPGVLSEPSHQQDSFSDGLLEGAQYSRPEVWDGRAVPPVLLSGHHAEVARFKRERSLELTARRRPELIAAARAAGRLQAADERFLRSIGL